MALLLQEQSSPRRKLCDLHQALADDSLSLVSSFLDPGSLSGKAGG